MAKHPHPSGRPLRPLVRKRRTSEFDYPPLPDIVYATPRLRPCYRGRLADAIGHHEIDQMDGDWSAPIGFVKFPEEKR